MIKRTVRLFSVLLFLSILTNAPGTRAFQASKSSGVACDRECLSIFITQYLNAMTAHRPKSLPVAANVKFTEDSKEIKLGEGLWKSVTRLTGYRRDILDVQQGVAVSFLVVEEDQSPVLFVMRLKVDGHRITEIETMAVRNQKEGMLFNPQNLQTVSKTMAYVPAKEQLNSREDAVRMALTYPAGLKIGSFEKVESPMVATMG